MEDDLGLIRSAEGKKLRLPFTNNNNVELKIIRLMSSCSGCLLITSRAPMIVPPGQTVYIDYQIMSNQQLGQTSKSISITFTKEGSNEEYVLEKRLRYTIVQSGAA